MYCLCGCGKLTKISEITDSSKGWTKGIPLKYIEHHRTHKILTGMTFGSWTVIGPGGRNINNSYMWRCKCECGRSKRVKTTDLTRGKSTRCKSCAQIGKCAGKKNANYKHGKYVGLYTREAKDMRDALKIFTAISILENLSPEILNPCMDIKAKKEFLLQKTQINISDLSEILFGEVVGKNK